MADHAALSSLPPTHWIHKALAKTKKGGAAKTAAPAKKSAMPTQDDPGDHEYR